MLNRALFFVLITLGFPALAQVQFTPEEVHRNQLMAGRIATAAAKCLDDTYADHIQFFNEWHVSKYYGNRRPDYATKAGRVAALMAYGVPQNMAATIAAQQVGTACITMTLQCLGRGFVAVGMQETWAKIYAKEAEGNNFLGTDLQKMLRQLGWKTYYWNADPSSNDTWDKEDRALNPLTAKMLAAGMKWNPVWGGHAARYNEVMKKGSYYGIPIDNAKALVGFGKQAPAAFKTVPFFVGIAHAGYHVFPGRRGEVIEAHSTRNLDSIDNLQFNLFSPLNGGGPKWTAHEHYRSGIIVVPSDF